jgi:4-diphosphocytidyl-2-C-methyl-D-erythritol kinase
MTRLERNSPCKINLLLNILGQRPDGFHELETVMQPIGLFDTLTLQRVAKPGVELTCNLAALPTDSGNLVHKAATAFFSLAGDHSSGVAIHLEKRVPLAAGLGGGSSNAATTLLLLNELYSNRIASAELSRLAASLGSDVPFFLQSGPALATGRGEQVIALEPFRALQGACVLLIHPGFGVSTAWAYQALAGFPDALHGRKGRAQDLLRLLREGSLEKAAAQLYNSLEAPVQHKYPVLQLYQEFLREHGAVGTLMSGSGSTTFALLKDAATASSLEARFKARFGQACWTAIVPF